MAFGEGKTVSLRPQPSPSLTGFGGPYQYRVMPSASRAVVFAGLLYCGAACTTVRPIKPDDYIPKNAPDVVWVTSPDKKVVAVVDPLLAGDTLKGVRQGSQDSVAVPLTALQTVTAKQPDRLKTTLLLLGAGVAAYGILYEAYISQQGPNRGGVDCGVYDTASQGDPVGAPKPYC